MPKPFSVVPVTILYSLHHEHSSTPLQAKPIFCCQHWVHTSFSTKFVLFNRTILWKSDWKNNHASPTPTNMVSIKGHLRGNSGQVFLNKNFQINSSRCPKYQQQCKIWGVRGVGIFTSAQWIKKDWSQRGTSSKHASHPSGIVSSCTDNQSQHELSFMLLSFTQLLKTQCTSAQISF